MEPSRRAQVAIEFFILLAIFLVALMAAAYVSVTNTYQITREQINLESSKVLEQASDKLNTAHLQGHGFKTNLTLPFKILGLHYNITRQNSTLVLKVLNYTFFKTLLSKNITGQLVNGTNHIENKNGEVVIS